MRKNKGGGIMRIYELKDGTYQEPKIKRRCKWKGCRTILADGNKNKYCFAHLSRGIELEWKQVKYPIHAKIGAKQRRGTSKLQKSIIDRYAC